MPREPTRYLSSETTGGRQGAKKQSSSTSSVHSRSIEPPVRSTSQTRSNVSAPSSLPSKFRPLPTLTNVKSDNRAAFKPAKSSTHAKLPGKPVRVVHIGNVENDDATIHRAPCVITVKPAGSHNCQHTQCTECKHLASVDTAEDRSRKRSPSLKRSQSTSRLTRSNSVSAATRTNSSTALHARTADLDNDVDQVRNEPVSRDVSSTQRQSRDAVSQTSRRRSASVTSSSRVPLQVTGTRQSSSGDKTTSIDLAVEGKLSSNYAKPITFSRLLTDAEQSLSKHQCVQNSSEERPTVTKSLSEHDVSYRNKAKPLQTSSSRHGILGGKSDDDDVVERPPTDTEQKSSPCMSRRSSLVVSDYKLNDRGVAGLRNLGNTCFMNSIIQCLSSTRPLLEYCLDSAYVDDVNEKSSRMHGTMIKEFANVLKLLWNPRTDSVSPVKFKDKIAQFAKRFVGYSEHDAHEFLIYLLEGLHEDVNRVREKKKRILDTGNEVEYISAEEKARISWSNHIDCDNSQIVDIFVGQLMSTLTCNECGYVSNTFEPFHDLSLPMKRSRSSFLNDSCTLLECFDLFTRQETLTGDDRPMCARCRCRRSCTKAFSVQKFPDILIIHLKRFSHGSYSKLRTSVECPLTELDLSKYAADSECIAAPLYSLFAVSNHTGSMVSGHYTAHTRHPYSGQWHCFNDTRVGAHKMLKLNSSEAYLLFYERQAQRSTEALPGELMANLAKL